jgi:hypothetical protein
MLLQGIAVEAKGEDITKDDVVKIIDLQPVKPYAVNNTIDGALMVADNAKSGYGKKDD